MKKSNINFKFMLTFVLYGCVVTKDTTFFLLLLLTIFPGNSRGYVCVKLFCCVGKFLTATSPRDERTSRMDPMIFFSELPTLGKTVRPD